MCFINYDRLLVSSCYWTTVYFKSFLACRNCLCNQCISSPMFWVRILFKRGVLDTTLCDKVCQWLTAYGRLMVLYGTKISSTSKTDRHDITKILLKQKVVLNTITVTPFLACIFPYYDSITIKFPFKSSNTNL